MSNWLMTVGTFLLLAAAGPAVSAPMATNADPLLAIDLNRSAIIADIVRSFESQPDGPAAVRLRERLEKLRADRLLAASLASSRVSLDAILVEAESPRSPAFSTLREKALGDADRDLVYTPIVPCPIVNTYTGPIGRLPAGSTTAFDAIAADFAPQGGQNACATQLPANMAAIAVQIAVVSPSNEGWLNLWPVGQTLPNNVSLGYYRNQAGDLPNVVTGSAIVPLCTSGCAGGKEFNLFTASEVVVTLTVAGYFTPPAGGAVRTITAGAGLTGGTITSTGTIGLAATNLLPTASCATNQVPKWNGIAWTCSNDGDSRLGTNTSFALASNGRECTLGEIILSAGFRGVGLPADGRLISISQNTALFALIGTTYGGNGTTTFALPDLRSVAPNGLTYTICDQGIFPSLR